MIIELLIASIKRSWMPPKAPLDMTTTRSPGARSGLPHERSSRRRAKLGLNAAQPQPGDEVFG